MQYDGSVRFKTEIDAKNMTSQMQTVINSIKKSEREATRLKEKMDSLRDTKIPTQEYTALQNELQKAESYADKLSEKLTVMEKSGADRTAQSYKKLLEQLKQTSRYADELRSDIEQMEASGKAFSLGADSEEYAKMADRVAYLNGNIQAGELKLKELLAKQKPVSKELDKMAQKSKKAFTAMSSGAKKSGGLLTTLASRFRGIMLSLLIFNWITKAFNAMVEGMKKGFENLSKHSSDYAKSIQDMKNAMSTLGNQFAAAFAPIVQMVIPWLIRLVNMLTTAMSYVAQFIAVLSGKNTFTRAKKVQDGYNKSLGGTAKAADKARGALAKFDDLDVWSKQEDASGGGEDAAGNMFEEVPVDPKVKAWLDNLLNKLKPIIDYAKTLKDVFLDGFWDGLGDYQYRFDIIKNGLQQIRDALIEIWTDPEVLSAADGYLQSLMYMLGSFVGMVASIAVTLGAALIGGLGKYMEENTDRIKKHLTAMFDIGSEINMLLAGLFQSIAYIFEALASQSGIRFISALIGSILNAAMGLAEVALKLGRDFLNMLIQPIIENTEGFRLAFEGMLEGAALALEGFKTMIDTVFDNVNRIYDEKFKPFFDSIAIGLSELVNSFLSVFNGTIVPILQRIGSRFGELYSQYIAPLITSFVTLFGNLASQIQVVWQSYVQPFVNWIITYVVPILSEVIGFLVDAVLLGIEGLIASITFFVDIINGFIESWTNVWLNAQEDFEAFWTAIDEATKAIGEIIDLFIEAVDLAIKGDWDGVWVKAGEIMDLFQSKVDNVLDAIRGILDGFFSWISEKVQAAINAIKSVVSALTSVGSYSGGQKNTAATYAAAHYSASSVSALSDLPHLASGAVIRGGNPFLAVLGDQRIGQTNIEAPLSTIERAVENVMSRNGYGVSGSARIVLQLNGQDVGEALIDDLLSVMNRKGLDVEVLGVT